MLNEDDFIIGNYDEDLQPRHIQQDNKDYAFALIIGEIERIRKLHGAYIWGFPIKWREENKPVKIRFGWEIEFDNGFCTSVGYQGKDFLTYQESLQDAIKYFKSNMEGNREIYPNQSPELLK